MFQTNGAAGGGYQCVNVGDTPSFTAGSIYSQVPISLLQDHVFSARFTPGCREDNGEGMVFTFQSIGPFAGSYTQTMGFRGLAPSIGIELDFEQDADDNDPSFDHLAIIVDGKLDHDDPDNSFVPIRIIAGEDDAEDCQIHFMTIHWMAEEKRIEVWIDCQLRISQILDISNLADPGSVFWGLTIGVNDSGVIYSACPDYIEDLTFERELELCMGGSATLVPSRNGDKEYAWYQGDELISDESKRLQIKVFESTQFKVISRDSCERRFKETFIINVRPDSLPLELDADELNICDGQQFEVTANIPEARYEWNTGSEELSILITEEGTYKVTASLNGCVNEDSVVVISAEVPQVDLGEEQFLCEGSILQLSTGLDNRFEYEWNTGSISPGISVSESGTYSVDVFSICGQQTAAVDITFENCLPIYVPDGFTPNGDGINDDFAIYSEDPGITLKEWRIYNRWGGTIHELGPLSLDQPVLWNGRIQGNQLVKPGVYTTVITVVLQSGKEVHASKTITVLY